MHTNVMKRIILSALFSLLMLGAFAQAYNNEWINYGQTYYKFKVGSTGLWRINQPTLAAAGLGNANAEDFVLWRNGEVVPVYTSVATGPIPANGFIEFYGLQNDGKPDKQLYRLPEYQLHDKYSLETDTSTYYLTVQPGVANSHYSAVANNVAGTSLTPESSFMYTQGLYYSAKINTGNAAVIGADYVTSSAYDNGEGWTSGDLGAGGQINFTVGSLNIDPSGPPVSFSYGAFGNANNIRTIRISLNGSPVAAKAINYFEAAQETINNIPVSLFSSNAVTYNIFNDGTVPGDRIVMSYSRLTYPRKYNFDYKTVFDFTLPARPDSSFIQISNFNAGGSLPVLYDLTNKKLMIGDLSDPSYVKFVLPPTATERQLVLLSRDAGSVRLVNNLIPRNFIDFSNAANQGDYIIVSNPLLYDDGNGNNYVDQYKQYRASAAGGSFNAKIYDISELIDQFAFGIKNHPSSIKNFLRFARDRFSQKPKFCLIIGKGVTYPELRRFESLAVTSRINLVPTFGWPASDNYLASETNKDPTPATPIGRISVVYPNEIKNYLDKVKQYEANLNSSSCTIADKAWMKQVMHIIGAEDAVGNQIDYYMSNPYTDTIQTAQYSGNVNRFRKTSDITIQQVHNEQVPILFQSGLGLVTYFGHSSPNTLQFSLDEPADLKNVGKYPFFIANGCQAGNNYLFDTLRLAQNLTLSEKNIVTANAGSIGFLASTHLGIVNFLNFYTHEFYVELSKKSYGKPFGEISKNTISYIMQTYTNDDFYNRQNSEQVNLNGDPAIKAYSFPKPDYVIEPQLVTISPQIISVAEQNFNVSLKMMNIGKGASDSIRVVVKRKYPSDGHEENVFDQKIPAIQFADSIQLVLPIQPLRDKGLNKLTFIVDADNVTDEICKTNNSISKDVFIYENELKPVYPADNSIINKQNISFSASTANALQPSQQYLMELDTTEMFNSPLKVSASATSIGGIISFTPTITFQDSTVYYWRTGVGDAATGNIIWNNASFVYLPNSTEGFNQSHYYQFKKDKYYNIQLDSNDRKFKFKVSQRNLKVRTGIYPYFNFDRIDVNLDFESIDNYGCRYLSFQFYVLDGKTLKPWHNTGSLYGSQPICQRPYRNFFEFSYQDSASRRKAMDFMNSVPDSNYILITNLGRDFVSSVDATTLMSDTSYLGSGVSLYHTFKKYGFELIDSFRANKPMIFIFKKNDLSFPAQQYIGNTTDWLVKDFDLRGLVNIGTIESPWFGPAKKWIDLHWDGKNLEPQPDQTSVEIIGQTSTGSVVSLATVNSAKDTTVGFIDAAIYPYLKLRLNNGDTVNSTPNQLRYWRLNGETLPEGAIAPNIAYQFKDVLAQGEQLTVKVAFKNITSNVFADSLTVKCVITDRNNVPNNFTLKVKAPPPGDTTTATFVIDTKNLSGVNTMYLVFNPDLIVPEQFLFNNFFYKDFTVNADNYKPILDVTFDGIHILSKDIISSKPHIQIKLKDDNTSLLLNDTSLFRIQVRYPDGRLTDVVFNSAQVQFTKATSGANNTALIDYFPTFTQDGQYELIVTGKDVNGNKSGAVPYRVLFTIINKPMISNMLNYPNPFTTSTAFVFTITGSEIPQNIRIQILTITGKVVREITKEELGPLRIGRNITEFKWDGTDQYGQKLANGVYLYRVITNLNGKSLDKYKSADDNTDKFFNNGYGKMYLMR
ncbi:MAG: hypothetical protein EKK37_02880 [Sphingobacteriales bacterium]|nr:MAG: hypothetical protein EKK37_02880 [Sphingobacteriales bacterium]